MYKKEVSELRRRFRYQKGNMNQIIGCYVNAKGEPGELFQTGLSLLEEEHVNALLGNVKKVLSTQVDKRFRELEFPMEEILGGSQHKMLMELRKSKLEDAELVQNFFRAMAEQISLEDPYVILMTYESYDLKRKSYDAMASMETADAADSVSVFSYLTCAVCPIKETAPCVEYQFPDRLFQGKNVQAVKAPELGFVFPAFTDFSTDIYHIWYYTKGDSAANDAFAETMFHITPTLSAEAAKDCFTDILEDTLAPSLDTLVELQKTCMESVEAAKLADMKPTVTKEVLLAAVSEDASITQEQKQAFEQQFDAAFGSGAELNPEVLLPSNGLKIEGAGFSIRIDPEYLESVQIQEINGRKQITIPLLEGAMLNGVMVKK